MDPVDVCSVKVKARIACIACLVKHHLIIFLLEDPDSSRGAFYFASTQNYFMMLTSLLTISQASPDPSYYIPNALAVNIMQCAVEAWDGWTAD